MTAALPSMRKRIPYQGILLGATALLASTALVFAFLLTKPYIAQQYAADLTASLRAVIPNIETDNDLLNDKLVIEGGVGSTSTTVYLARNKGEVVAALFQVIGYGYAGEIVAVMGVDREGRITAVRVVSHKETPGLGDKIEPAKSPWIDAFNGKGLGNPEASGWGVRKDGGEFDQFSGATITPRALVAAIKAGLEFQAAHHDEMFAGVASEAPEEKP